MQERGARYQVADELGIPAPPLDDRVCHTFAPSLHSGGGGERKKRAETPEVVAARIRKALKYIRPEQVILAPDCGMKYLPRAVADGKLKAMVEAAQLLRDEYASH